MKINIKKQSQPKSTFKGLIPCSTTLNFGQSTPIFTKELVPNTQITIDVKNFVRTAVMALPTFGDYKLLTHAVFVPYASLYKPFDSLLSATKYNTGTPYTPTQVPVLQPMTLLSALEVDSYGGCIHLIKQVAQGHVVPDSTPWQIVPNTETSQVNSYFQTSFVGNPANYSSTHNVPDFLLGSHYDSGTSKTTNYAITFSEQAKYLMRILNGLGYSFSDTGYLSALPLLAITKSMFDIFSPQQTDTENTPFESTYLYRLIMSKMIGGNGYVMSKDDMIELFKMLLDNTYYINDDFIAMHSLNTATTQTESITLPYGNYNITQNSVSNTNELQKDFADDIHLTSDRLKSIFRLGSLIKANTQIAGRLKEFLRSRFGSSVGDNHDSIIVKTFLTDIDVSDIFATASTSGETSSILGEYGGRAIGKGDGLIKFDTNCFGIFMILCTIIQRRHYFSGLNPDLLHRQKDEFYNPIFDSLGYSISPKAILNGGRNCAIDNIISTSFGYKPRYLEYKFFKPIVAGDFNRPSQRNTLDAFIGSAYPNNTLTPVYSKNINKPAFRTQLYNYNNIFYEHEEVKVIGDDVNSPYYTAISDPFIVHTLLNVTMHAPMLSVGDSFETNEDGKNTIQVEKA